MLVAFTNISYGFDTVGDYTGEAFFEPPALESSRTNASSSSNDGVSKHTTPPIKQIRQKLRDRSIERAKSSLELAPTAEDLYAGEIETSEYASKEIEDNFEKEYEELKLRRNALDFSDLEQKFLLLLNNSQILLTVYPLCVLLNN